MSKIYQPFIAAKIIEAMESVALSNNGYAQMSLRGDVASALKLAGYKVEKIGLNLYVVYSAAAWDILVAERNAEIRRIVDGKPAAVDYEAKILARNDAYLFA
jgi:hypothetical protein